MWQTIGIEMRSKWFRLATLVLSLCLTMTAMYFWLKFFEPYGWRPYTVKMLCVHWLNDIFYYPLQHRLATSIYTFSFFAVLGFTLAMEKLFPADPNQPLWSIALLQDFVWFFYEAMLHAVVLTTWVLLLKTAYERYFSFLTVEAVEALPGWLQFCIAVLLTDYLFWLQHWINHRVPLLWRFHEVHHSQVHLNFFTDFRYHVMEYLVRHTVLVVPFLIFTVQIPEIVVFSFFRAWYTRFYHGNIRTNLGPLRYILVTPQSHRMHHSREPCHYNKNFGSLFSIWDYLFRTKCEDVRSYPQTGIPDSGFPLETSSSPVTLITMPLRQLVYPFLRNKK